jgi:hypothetical protein
MFNPFKNHKTNETLKVDKNEESTVEQVEKLETEESVAEQVEKLEDSEPIDVRLEALTDYFDQCEANGVEMTKEMVETEIRDRLGLEVEELLGAEIADPEIKTTHQEVIAKIKEIMNQKAEAKETPLSFLRDKVFKSKFAKAAFVSAMLLLKFNPTQAADHKNTDNIKDKVEHEVKKPVGSEGDGNKTFKASAEDFSSPDGVVIMSATSNFETDKADIKDASKIINDFNKFLSSIDKDNFNSLISQDWTVKGSSDERRTNWAGGNEGLTQARIQAVVEIIKTVLASHDFAGKLSPDQIKQVLSKAILESYPTSGTEKGVTYLSDLVNEDTNESYTEQELKTMKEKDPREYQKLLDKCRYTNFELTASKDEPKFEKIDPKTPPIKIETPIKTPDIPKIIIESENFDEYYFLIDESPSMTSTKKHVSKELASLNIEKPFMMANYSDDLSRVVHENDSKSMAKKIIKMDTEHSSGRELSFAAAIKFLEKIEKKQEKKIKNNEVLPNGVMYVTTDEILQDVDRLEELKALSIKTNIKIEILVFKGSKFLRLGLDDVKKQINDNKIANNIARMNYYDKNDKIIGQRMILKSLADADGNLFINPYSLKKTK